MNHIIYLKIQNSLAFFVSSSYDAAFAFSTLTKNTLLGIYSINLHQPSKFNIFNVALNFWFFIGIQFINFQKWSLKCFISFENNFSSELVNWEL